MASVLGFERYWDDLDRQLLRRIGYTNGLHKIRRFARVVEYLYKIMPTSIRALVDTIITEENKCGDSNLGGKDYARGIIDVARSLLFVERFGPKLALSSQGYACHALNNDLSVQPLIDMYLLQKIIETDGEYTLNILRLVEEGHFEVADVSPRLMQRFLALIAFKISWVEESVQGSYAKRLLATSLQDARKKLQGALQKTGSLVEFFFKHTVAPRLEWLGDLNCVAQDGKRTVLTETGSRLLIATKRLGCSTDDFVFLPLDSWLATELGLPRFVEEDAVDFSWKLLAATASERVTVSALPDDLENLMIRVRQVYSSVKLANFNEADGLSLFEVFAVSEAAAGRVLENEPFENSLQRLVQRFPSDIFKLSKRRGRGLYIALKQSAL